MERCATSPAPAPVGLTWGRFGLERPLPVGDAATTRKGGCMSAHAMKRHSRRSFLRNGSTVMAGLYYIRTLADDAATGWLLGKRLVVVLTCLVGLYFIWQLARSLR